MARLSVSTAWCRAVRPVCPSPSFTSARPNKTSSLTQLKWPPRTASCSAVKPSTDRIHSTELPSASQRETNVTKTSSLIIRNASVLWHFWRVRKSIQSVKIEWWGADVAICLQWGADCLHMVQLMPLIPKTPSSLASFKSRLVLPFWYRLTQVVLEKRPLNECSSSLGTTKLNFRQLNCC